MGEVLQAQPGRGGREGRACSWRWGQLLSSARLSSRDLLLKHCLSIPDPWAGEAGVLELNLHFCPLPLSSQEQGIEITEKGCGPQDLGHCGLVPGSVHPGGPCRPGASLARRAAKKALPSLHCPFAKGPAGVGGGVLSSRADSALTGLRNGGVGSGPLWLGRPSLVEQLASPNTAPQP